MSKIKNLFKSNNKTKVEQKKSQSFIDIKIENNDESL